MSTEDPDDGGAPTGGDGARAGSQPDAQDAKTAESAGSAEPQPSTEPTSTGLDKRKTIIGSVVAIVFLVVIFVRVIPQFGDYSGAFETLSTMTWLSLAIISVVVVWYLFVYGWAFVAATPGLRYRQGFVINQSAFLISNGIPGGGAVGLGLQYAQLISYKITPTAATAAIGTTGIWGVFITLGLPVTGIAALSLGGDDAGKYAIAAAIGFAALVAVIGTFALILRSEEMAEKIGRLGDRIINPILDKFGRGWRVNATTAILALRRDTVGLVRKRWIVITIAQIAISWSQFAILYTALVLVTGGDGTVQLLAAYGAWAISQIGIMIPITPGGLGTVDAALIALLTSVGVSSADATAAALVWRASSYIPQMIVGVISVLFWRWEEQVRAKKESAGTTA